MIIIVMGVSGSGKSTVGRQLAQRLGWTFLDADDYHSPENVAKMSRGEPLTEDDRRDWLAALRQEIADHVRRDDSAVLACSALTRRARKTLHVDPQAVRFVFLEGNAELIRGRMEAREHFMPPQLLASQMATLEEPGAEEAIRCPIDQPPEVLVEQVIERLGVAAEPG